MSTTRINPIEVEVVRDEFQSAAEELVATLERLGKTFFTYMLKDRVCVLLDAEHRIVSQSDGCPVFLGNFLGTATRLTEELLHPEWHEGDVWAVNDPYVTGSHSNDVAVFGPVHHDGELVGFVATHLHWFDIAKTLGDPWGIESTSIVGEGLRITPVKVVDGGVERTDVADLICRNSLYPAYNAGDLAAQIACVRLGASRWSEIIDRHGPAAVLACREAVCAETEQLERDAIAAIPDGVYRAEGCIDDDGTGEPCWIRVAVTVEGDRMTIDLGETDDARAGWANCGEAQSLSVVNLAYKTLLHPDRPFDGGALRALTVKVRRGSMLAAQEPSPTTGFWRPLCLLQDLVAAALADVLPGSVPAASLDDTIVGLTGVDDRTGLPFFGVDSYVGGWGAWQGSDGEGALISKVQGSVKNTPIEVLESNNPLRVTQYRLRADSGGAGEWRGGVGIVRDTVLEAAEASLIVLAERKSTPIWGVRGGMDGAACEVVVNPGAEDERRLQLAVREPLRRGDVLRVQTAGGGGFGDPRKRDRALVRDDVRNGLVSAERAQELYGQEDA